MLLLARPASSVLRAEEEAEGRGASPPERAGKQGGRQGA